ncbi:hypothetical protein MTR62_03785 [Novosphingobium sp. 1949]|uniref:DUF3618 domain-containing protein n=1 Tax=Novosphingobium organovorum TaxID=2930092 RepID=A0ABT0BAD5_9SPHN|nr:hypothetical protein [Novosphingobium organovorum]MCJ2181830.1 hypothetical protein [Novosphingobium organovorum]
MSASGRKVEELRAARDAARAAFDTHYNAIKADMEERGLAGRIVDESLEKVRAPFDEAVAVIESNPAVVAGTLGALVLWFLKTPIVAWFETLLSPDSDQEEETDNG